MTNTGRKVGSRDRQNKMIYIIKRKRYRQKEWRKKLSRNQRKQKKSAFVKVGVGWNDT
jgi:hypothetical protein